MLAKTHKRIAKRIAENCNLGKRESSLLIRGSIDPDKWGNFPHHSGKDGEIANNILTATQLFEKKDDECYHKLGIALHYIADKWTLRPRTRDEHTKYEVAIEASSLLDNSQLKKAIVDSLFPTKVEKAFLAFLDNINIGISSISESEAQKLRLACIHVKTNVIKWILTKGDVLKKHQISLEDTRDHEVMISDFGKQVLCYSTQSRPSNWGSPTIDLNFAYIIGLEMVRNVLSQLEFVSNIIEKKDNFFNTRIWCFPLNLKNVKQALDNTIKNHYNIYHIQKHQIVSSNIECSDITDFYILKGYVEALFKKGFLGGFEFGTIDFIIKIRANDKKIVSIEHSRSK